MDPIEAAKGPLSMTDQSMQRKAQELHVTVAVVASTN